MSNPNLEQLRAKANQLVEQPGVYLMKNKQHEIIYIGKAKRLKQRVVSYFRQNKGHQEKVKKMVSQVEDFDYIIAESEFEALVLECSLIKQYLPKYNILLKDDKGYHYLKITDEPYPRIQAVRQKLQDHATYLGPYTSSFSVTQSVDEVNKVFMLPTCHKKFPDEFRKERPCLNFHIKKCMGICRGNISQNEYQDIIKEATGYLKKGNHQAMKQLRQQMEQAAEQLDFEKAAKLRDRLQAIERLNQSQKVLMNHDKDQDFIAIEQVNTKACVVVLQFRNGQLHNKNTYLFEHSYDKQDSISEFLSQYYQFKNNIPKFIALGIDFPDIELYQDYLSQLAGQRVTIHIPQKGEQKRLIDMAQTNALEELSRSLEKKSKEVVALQELSQLLGLSKIPEYIESYDISNIGNDYMVGAMIVFENAKPLKKAYKKFSMKEHQTQNDYACMSEMITRRFQRYLDPNETDKGFKRLPDLILLDGGSAHVSIIAPILKQMNLSIPLFGMVKDSKHKTRAIALDGGEIQISTFRSAFRLVTQIQEEVHRFAITYQRKKHQQNTFTLELTSIKGIGEKKAFALLKKFKTKKALKQATLEQIRSVAKLNAETAALVYDLVQKM